MPKQVTGTNTYDNSVTVPINGERVNQGSVEPGFTALANRTTNLNARCTTIESGAWTKTGTATFSNGATVNNTLTVAGSETISSNLTVGGNVSVSGDLSCDELTATTGVITDLNISSNLSVGSGAVFHADLAIDDDLIVGGDAIIPNVTGDTNFEDNVTFENDVTVDFAHGFEAGWIRQHRPARFYEIKDDFSPGIIDATAQRLISDTSWAYAASSGVTTSLITDSIKNPGRLAITLSTGADRSAELGKSASSAFIPFSSILNCQIIMAVTDAGGNTGTSFRAGYAGNNSQETGGTGAVYIRKSELAGSSNWQFVIRVNGNYTVQSTLKPWVSGEYIDFMMKYNFATDQYDIYVDQVFWNSIAASSFPTGNANFGARGQITSGDGTQASMSIDYLYSVNQIVNRHG